MPTTITKQLLNQGFTGSMAFDGITDIFSTAGGGGLPDGGVSPYSFSFWLKLNSTPLGDVRFLASCDPINTKGRYQFLVRASRKTFAVVNGDTYNFTGSETSTVMTIGTWYHYTVTSLGTGATNSVNVYVNGSVEATWDGAVYSASYSPRFTVGGTIFSSYSNFADIAMDEVAVWRSHVLTPAEVTNIYAAGSLTDLANTNGVTRPDSYWRCGDLDDTDGASGVIKDRVGSYDMTAQAGNGLGAPALSSSIPPINSRAIEVVATSSPGTLIHTAPAATSTSIDEIYIQASNEDVHPVDLTLEWGGVTNADHMMLTIPSHTGDNLVVAGRILTGGLEVRAYASSARKVKLLGYANRITPPVVPNLDFSTSVNSGHIVTIGL